ncbi:hypothetical protein MCAMS1_02172 [biofilm metagenome]
MNDPIAGNESTQLMFLDIHSGRGKFWNHAILSHRAFVIYVYIGELTISRDDEVILARQPGHLMNGDNLGLQAKDTAAHFIVLTAMPLNEPAVQSGPFVMNTMAELEQPYRDYRDEVILTL